MEEYKSIKEVSEMLKITVQALYNRLNNLDVKFKEKHTKQINKKLMLDSVAIEKLDTSNILSKSKEENDFKETLNDEKSSLMDNYINDLKAQIEDLKETKESLLKSTQNLEILLKLEKDNTLKLVEKIRPEDEMQKIDELKNELDATKSNNKDLTNQVSDLMQKLKELEQTKIDAPAELTKKTLIQRIFNL